MFKDIPLANGLNLSSKAIFSSSSVMEARNASFDLLGQTVVNHGQTSKIQISYNGFILNNKVQSAFKSITQFFTFFNLL